MQIIHLMADGTIRKSVDGVVIQNDEFYQVAQGILEKRKEGSGNAETRKTTHS